MHVVKLIHLQIQQGKSTNLTERVGDRQDDRGVQARQSQWYFIQFATVSATYVSDCLCRREVCNWLLAASCFSANVLHHTCVPHPLRSDYRLAHSLVSFTSDFSERLSTFTYSYQESCSLYPRCTPYFSVEHTVSPQSAVSISSSGCSVEYTIHNLMRCVSYQSNATALLRSQRGNPVVMGDTVMQSE